ncbi:MAG TPA: STAS domain-containing protein [Acetobacteraceae bacterium]|nr:STAS domain-containing protein [Acetobacteraceae bacterium]
MSDQPDSIPRIGLHGAMSIRDAGALHTDLVHALSLHTTVHIDGSDLESADLSVIQVLLAAHRSARASGKQVLLHPPPAAALAEVLQRGGFVQAGANCDAFWSGR